jgi:DNA polymerase III epsilon subunit-like protein
MPPFRQSIIEKVRQIWAGKPVFLDTETTGLDNAAEIVEISIVDYDGSVLLDTLVRPGRPIPSEAVRVHGISNEMVRQAPTWLHVWPRVEVLLSGRLVGIYNMDFDLRMMRQTHQQIGMPWRTPPCQLFCIMKLYSDYYGAFKWQTLEAAGKQCGLPLPHTHRARDDTLLARAVFQCMLVDQSRGV